MRVLLDTHVFLWWVQEAAALPHRAKVLLQASDTELVLSAVVAWEIAIKFALGRLELPQPIEQLIREQMQLNAMVEMPVTMSHAITMAGLPLHHRDPFDRTLVAQARVEGLAIVTGDPLIRKYDVETIW